MEKQWIKVYAATDPYQTELVRHVLIENKIEAVSIDKKGYPYDIGEVEIYVQKTDFDQALEIIKQNEF